MPNASVIVYVPPGVVPVPCLRVDPGTTPWVPILAAFVWMTACQTPARSCQATTLAYEPLALTVMICDASPTTTGTGNLNAGFGLGIGAGVGRGLGVGTAAGRIVTV